MKKGLAQHADSAGRTGNWRSSVPGYKTKSPGRLLEDYFCTLRVRLFLIRYFDMRL